MFVQRRGVTCTTIASPATPASLCSSPCFSTVRSPTTFSKAIFSSCCFPKSVCNSVIFSTQLDSDSSLSLESIWFSSRSDINSTSIADSANDRCFFNSMFSFFNSAFSLRASLNCASTSVNCSDSCCCSDSSRRTRSTWCSLISSISSSLSITA